MWALLMVPPVPQDADRFTLPARLEEGKEKCPYDPSRGYTGLIVGKRHRTHMGRSCTWTWWLLGLSLVCGGGRADGCMPHADGGLYTATRYEFRSLPDIRRNLHQRPLKMEESPLHWLNGKAVPVPVPSDWWHWCMGIAPGACPEWFAARGN